MRWLRSTRAGRSGDWRVRRDSQLFQARRVPKMAEGESRHFGWNLDSHLQEEFGEDFDHLCRSARRSDLLRLDRWAEEAARCRVLAAEILPAASEERMVENQHRPRRAINANGPDARGRTQGDRSGEERWPLECRVRFAKPIHHA